jgi:hypothetical protein
VIVAAATTLAVTVVALETVVAVDAAVVVAVVVSETFVSRLVSPVVEGVVASGRGGVSFCLAASFVSLLWIAVACVVVDATGMVATAGEAPFVVVVVAVV